LVLLFGPDQSGIQAQGLLTTQSKHMHIWMSACPKVRRNICTANERYVGKYWNEQVLTGPR